MRKYSGERTVCAPRAEILQDGVPYVAGWAVAQRSTNLLAEGLLLADLTAGFGVLRADVSVHGQGLVYLGALPAAVVDDLARLLAAGLCAELDAASDDSATT